MFTFEASDSGDPVAWLSYWPVPIKVSDVAGNKPKVGETWACEVDHRGELLPASPIRRIGAGYSPKC